MLLSKTFVFLISILLFSFRITAQPVTWMREYPLPSTVEKCYIDATLDSGFVISGASILNNYYVLRLSESGDTIWSRIFDDGYPFAITALADGNMLVAGQSSGTEGRLRDGYIHMIDGLGNSVWKRKYGIGLSNSLTDIVAIDSLEYYSIGVSDSKYSILKFNSSGDTAFFKVLDFGSCVDSDFPRIQRIYNETFFITGRIPAIIGADGSPVRLFSCGLGKLAVADTLTRSFYFVKDINNYSIRIIKVDSSSNILWKNDFNIERRFLTSLGITFDEGKLLVCGTTYPDTILNYSGFLLKISQNGNVLWFRNYPVSNPYRGIFLNEIILAKDGGYASSGYINPANFGTSNMLVVKTDTSGYAILLRTPEDGIQNVYSTTNLSAFPNPFNSSTKLEFKIDNDSKFRIDLFDLRGRIVKSLSNANKNLNRYSLTIEAEGLTSGIYFAVLSIFEKYETKHHIIKLVYLK